ncbi:hypothetical protein [Variovorax sp. E3]|uniref:hypothetical protein n=1 Tax=Variovorax sp. E3 TaxID=1914993 RepID=UPI0018DE5751|nr:hypothetical protein [Variovorax sp. E3]
MAYIVTRQCARMRAWAQQLRKLHNADETYKTEEGMGVRIEVDAASPGVMVAADGAEVALQ